MMASSSTHPFSDDPTAGPTAIFPNHAFQILSSCIHIIGSSVLAYCVARRIGDYRLHNFQSWRNLAWAQLCLLLVFLFSWLFLSLSGVLVSGVGLSYSETVCSLGIFTCIFFYAGSKALTYLFLVERVWIVWSVGDQKSRLHSRVYKICATVFSGYVVIFVLMLLGHINWLRNDGSCIIGLKPFASIPLLAYDLFVNVFLTCMFIWPLVHQNIPNPGLRRVAWKTLIAAGAALTTSTINICVLTILHGQQLGWVCLGSCATDVTINAVVLFRVTTGGGGDDGETTHRMPFSFRNGITITQTTVTHVSPPSPKGNKRDNGYRSAKDKSSGNILELPDRDPSAESRPASTKSGFAADAIPSDWA